MISKANIDWSNLSFSYIKTDYSYISKWSDGKWDEGKMITENTVTISQSSTALHYGQQCFEGLKAYERKDGRVNLFRPSENAKRINNSCRRLMMPEIPVEKFIDACVKVVEANMKYVPPYGTGATLYLRPFIIGVGDNLGVRSAQEFIFCVFCSPVGPYFKGGMKPIKLSVSEYDRAAPYGTGGVKVGGNYAASLLPHDEAAKEGYSDCIYLDPATHTKIEEVGAANFFGITKDNKFITPKSPSILPSITKYSLMAIAKDYFKLQTEERDVYIDKLDVFTEAGACGTAAVISPIGSIRYKNNIHVFYSETEVGPITKKLYDCLTGIQFGDVPAPEGWIVEI